MDAPRVLPDRPSLRYLKLEAKRRVSAGETRALHEAQLAIAQEHGFTSWTTLKRAVAEQRGECQPLAHLRWLVSRFAEAGRPGWTPPADAELREHFAEDFLVATPPDRLVGTVAGHAADLRGQLTLIDVSPLRAVVEIAGIRVTAMSETAPPHRLVGLARLLLGSRITDARLAAPESRASGDVPSHAARVIDRTFTSLGVPGLLIAGQDGKSATGWAVARGWADLEKKEVLSPNRLFPATWITTIVTAVAVLRLVADRRIGLDDPVIRHLGSVRLADDTISIRALLTHTGGVETPAELFATRVGRLEALCGPILSCRADRGSFRVCLGGFGVLGQVVANVTGHRYEEAARRLVLEPLGMRSSHFPSTATELAGGDRRGDGLRPVTGYALTDDGTFRAEARSVCTLPAAGGLWTTAADLLRFGLGWASLLPSALVREALRPQASRGPQLGHSGLGWMIARNGDFAGCAGDGPGSSASLLVRLSDQAVRVAMANRQVPVEPVLVEVLSTRPGQDSR